MANRLTILGYAPKIIRWPAMNYEQLKAYKIVAAADQVSCNVEEEVVILNMGSGIYYGLNEVGAFIWDALQAPVHLEDLERQIMAHFEIDSHRCRDDILDLIEELLGQGLVEIVDQIPAKT